jgi:small-conductance mechanosensitive channel
MAELWAAGVAGSAWLRWSFALSMVLAGTGAFLFAKAILARRLARIAPLTSTGVDDLVVEMLSRTAWPFPVALSALVALAAVDLPAGFERVGRGFAFIVCLFQVGRWGAIAIRGVLERSPTTVWGNVDDPARRTVARMAALAARTLLWAALMLVALDNFGVNITTLIAGLGVGGVAVALATQNILGDLFASVSIVLDKPFVPGDFVIVDDLMGTIEQIGVKTTRVRSLSGEQIIFSNADLLKSRIRNFKRMSERRVAFRLGVVYGTPAERLQALPGMLREIIQAQGDRTRFDRAHFVSYGDFALVFEVVYFVLSPDYNVYMDVHQGINCDISRRFADAGIEFAYPTQTLHLRRA